MFFEFCGISGNQNEVEMSLPTDSNIPSPAPDDKNVTFP